MLQKNTKCIIESDTLMQLFCESERRFAVSLKMKLICYLTDNNHRYVLWLIGCATQHAMVYGTIYFIVSHKL